MILLELISAYLGIGIVIGVIAAIYAWFATEPAKRPMIPWGFVLLSSVLKDLLFWPFSLLALGGVCLLKIRTLPKKSDDD